MVSKTHSSAGVYHRIRDFSNLSGQVAGMRIGMVGCAERGPVNTVFRTYTADDWTQYFGKRNHVKYGYMGIGAKVMHPFTNSMYNVRLAPEAKYAAAHLTVDDVKALSPRLYLSSHTDADGNIIGVSSPDELGWLPTDAGLKNELGIFYAANPGKWNDKITVFIQPNVPKGLDPIKDRARYDTSKFKVLVYENFETILAVPDESHVCTFDYFTDEDGIQFHMEDVLLRDSKILRFKRNEYCEAVPVVRSANLTFIGGDDGRTPTSAEIAVAYAEHFSDPEGCSCNLLVNVMGFDHVVHRAMLEASEPHYNCNAWLNVSPDLQTVRNATNYRDSVLNVSSYYGALFSGDFRVFDQEEARPLFIPMAIHAATVYMRSGFVKAPAGIRRSDHLEVLGARHVYKQDERNVLTNYQINYPRKMPDEIGGGYALWEQLTLYRKATAMRNINVRAVSGYILELCASKAKYGLFDPNDRVLRLDLKTKAEAELKIISQAGALNVLDGATPYVVICDESNNTSSAIANGDLILDVVIDPTASVRRIFMRYNINPKGSTVTVQ